MENTPLETKSFSLPLGPIHVALEEPMYFKLDLEGERDRKSVV